MYSVNFSSHFGSGFENAVLKEAKKRNMGIIVLKALAKQQWQKPDIQNAGMSRLMESEMEVLKNTATKLAPIFTA